MKTKFRLMAALLVVMLLFAACGGGAEPADSGNDSTAGTAPAADAADGDAAPAASGDGNTIVYWSMWEATEPQGVVIQEAVDAYMAATGNTVDLQFKGRTGIREGLQPALDANNVIDLFDEDIDRVNATWGAYLADLEELAAAADYEATANAGLMAACREAGGGTLKSIPYQPNVFAFFYNKDIFDEVGITAVPTTWEEFLAACETIKAGGYIPITTDDEYIRSLMGYHLGRLVGEERIREIVADGLWAEEPAVLKMAQDYENLAAQGYFSPNVASNVWPMGQNSELALGEVAMYLNGSWLPNEVKEIAGPEFRWGCFNYPALEGGVTGVEAANFGAQVYGINKNSQVKEQAFELIGYITKGEFDNKLAQESLGMPADSTNTVWPEVLAEVKPVMESLTTRWTWAVGVESNVDMTPILTENFTKLCGGTMTAQEFVDTMEAAK